MYLAELRHQSQAVAQFKVEPRAEGVDERVGVLEILRMLIEVAQDIGAIVVVSDTLFVCIGLVEGDTCDVRITGQTADTVCIGQVAHGEHQTLLQTVFPDESISLRIVVGIVGLIVAHRLVQFEDIHLQRNQRVTKTIRFIEEKPYLT